MSTQHAEAIDANPRAVVGGNNPPLSPLEMSGVRISRLHDEISTWLVGKPIPDQDVANDITNLLNDVRKAVKEADEARKIEKKPHDEAAKAVDAAYKPIITKGNTLAECCKEALTVFLRRQDEERRRIAEAQRIEADRLKAEAEEAIRASSGNLLARDEAEQKLKDAKKAEWVASKTEKTAASAGTGELGRAVSLRTVNVVQLTNPAAALAHYKSVAPDELKQFLTSMAERDVRAGKRDIPGFTVAQEKKAV